MIIRMAAIATIVLGLLLTCYSAFASHVNFIVGSVPFTPASISGLILWLDGADSTSSSMTLSGSNVTTWKDKSGNGYNFSGASSYPTLVSSAINGNSAVLYNTGSFTNSTMSFSSSNSYTFIFVIKFNTLNGGSNYGGLASFKDSTNMLYFLEGVGSQTNGNLTMYANSAYGGWYTNNSVVASNTTYNIMMTYGTGGFSGWNAYLSGSALSLTSSDKGNSHATANEIVNARLIQNSNVDHYIAEVIYYSKVLSSSEKTSINSYILSKWGI